jgi:ribonuclease E
MLDEDNPTTTDGADSPELVTVTTRPRRRAASRPAGPPPAAVEAPSAEVPPAAAPERPARPRRTRAKVTAAPEPEMTTEPEPAQTPEPAADAPARRARKKAAVAVFSAPTDDSPAVVGRGSAPTGHPLFQPPDPTLAQPLAADDDEEATLDAADNSDEGSELSQVADADAVDDDEDDDEGGTGAPHRRRRRRGGRGRKRRPAGEEGSEAGEPDAEPDADADADAGEPHAEDDESDSESATHRRRRRRRRSGSDAELGPDDPPNTVVRVREPRKRAPREDHDEVTALHGSTRLEAKKQRRREGRDQGRRRVPVITESEFLARRESVERVMVVRQTGERTQIGVLEDGILVEHYVNRASSTSFVGNVYLGRVQNVLPSMEAAFVDIGKGRNAVLYAGEVNWDAAGLDGQPRRIEHALKSGDQVLVQVTKDPVGHKGSRLTAQISLPGRFLVYVPDGSMTGISRKLPDTERTRLKAILREVVPEGAGVIVRTAAEGASEEELRRDVARLTAQWDDISKKSKSASAPALLYGEPDLTVRVIRDIFNEDFAQLIVSGDDAWDIVQAYIGHVAPDLLPRLSRWTQETDVFAAHRIDEQLTKALDRKVWLPSGGSLVIDRTEAMTVVDVNTGKFTGAGGNLEETVTRNNLEAAEEIVRQLRLRDVGGIIVIDFIDMVLENNRDLVLRRLLECLGRDRTRHQVAEVTSLGLVQMTRKRVGQGLIEAFSEVCETCHGRGVIVHMDPIDDRRDGSGDATAEIVSSEGGRRRRGRGRSGGDDGGSGEADGHTEPKPKPKPKPRSRSGSRAAGPAVVAAAME